MFELPALAYAYSALEPVISETTLRTHHGKHHARYVEVVTTLLGAEAPSEPLEAVIARAERQGDRKLFNNAAQVWNHGFFWQSMRPEGAEPGGLLAARLIETFGDLDSVKAAFLAEGGAHFGSGWLWLIAGDGQLSVVSTHDAATPITSAGATPLLVCDLWEHAYYLDYKNDRAGFLTAWWDRLANWPFAESQYAAALNGAPSWRYPVASTEAVEVSSPVCHAGSAEDRYMGYLDCDALAGELNGLLEAERAGARVGMRLVDDADDPELKALARVIRDDEVRWCRMLSDALKGLGAEPSPVVGAFYDKAMAISDVEARIAFVNRGQDWVVRKLNTLLPRVRDDALHASLREMLGAHERNIAAAAEALDRRQHQGAAGGA